ncbi:tRNA-splicing endonuclease subunit Sen15 [Naviculisporaceae sp. PSN 640]
MSTEHKHLDALAQTVAYNLEHQHDWTQVKIHTRPDLPRPIIYGLPPKRLYIHPDEQIAMIKAEKERGAPIVQTPEFEWVIPLHLSEKWSVGQFAAVFDVLEAVPPGKLPEDEEDEEHTGKANAEWKLWKGRLRKKRILLATVQDDSTVTYYYIHDGLTKPRQN